MVRVGGETCGHSLNRGGCQTKKLFFCSEMTSFWSSVRPYWPEPDVEMTWPHQLKLPLVTNCMNLGLSVSFKAAFQSQRHLQLIKVWESVFRQLVILRSKGLHQCFSSLGIWDSFFGHSCNLNTAQKVIFHFKGCKGVIIHGRDLCLDFHCQMPLGHCTIPSILADANPSVSTGV